VVLIQGQTYRLYYLKFFFLFVRVELAKPESKPRDLKDIRVALLTLPWRDRGKDMLTLLLMLAFLSCQGFPDARASLVSSFLCGSIHCMRSSGVRSSGSSGARTAVATAFVWCQHSSGVSTLLVPALLWCQHSSGASAFLVSAFSGASTFWCQRFFWCQHFSVAGALLVSALFWCQSASGARTSVDLNLETCDHGYLARYHRFF
jgi:hypothetical protein